MNKQKINSFFSNSLLATGALIIVVSSSSASKAQVYNSQTLEQAHFSAPIVANQTSIMGQLALGMLLMLLGFGFHAYLVSHKDKPVNIKVHAAPKKKKRIRNKRNKTEIIWMERTFKL